MIRPNKLDKVLFFGSDLVSKITLQRFHLKAAQAELKNPAALTALCPPFRRPRTPLAELHSYLKKTEVPIDFLFRNEEGDPIEEDMAGKDLRRLIWDRLEAQIKEKEYDIGVIASFGHMIPPRIIDAFSTQTMLVMHPSLLPKFRGACPLQHTILSGEKEAGVSVIEISKNKFDAGKILAQESVPLDPLSTTFETLQKEMSLLGGNLLFDVLNGDFDQLYEDGIVQSEAGEATPAPMIPKEFGDLAFSELSQEDLLLRFNCLYGSNTRPKFVLKEISGTKNLKQVNLEGSNVFAAPLTAATSDQVSKLEALFPGSEPGRVAWDNKQLKGAVFIKCQGEGQWVKCDALTFSGAGKVKPTKFFNLFRKVVLA